MKHKMHFTDVLTRLSGGKRSLLSTFVEPVSLMLRLETVFSQSLNSSGIFKRLAKTDQSARMRRLD